jgi:hypothetical protein
VPETVTAAGEPILNVGSEMIPAESSRRAAEYRRLAQAATVRARAALSRRTWTSDPGLRAQVDAILALPPEERLRQLEAEVAFFADARPAAQTGT